MFFNKLLRLVGAAWVALAPEPWELKVPPQRLAAAALCVLLLGHKSPFLYFQF